MSSSVQHDYMPVRVQKNMFGYQREWHGNTTQYFNGRLLIGPINALVANIFDIAVVVKVFIDIFYAYLLLWDDGYQILISIAIVLGLVFTYNCFICSYTDPGVLLFPKNFLSYIQQAQVSRNKAIEVGLKQSSKLIFYSLIVDNGRLLTSYRRALTAKHREQKSNKGKNDC